MKRKSKRPKYKIATIISSVFFAIFSMFLLIAALTIGIRVHNEYQDAGINDNFSEADKRIVISDDDFSIQDIYSITNGKGAKRFYIQDDNKQIAVENEILDLLSNSIVKIKYIDLNHTDGLQVVSKSSNNREFLSFDEGVANH